MTDRQQSETNPISSLYDDLWELVSEMVIKPGTRMDSSESLDDRKYVDEYRDAANRVDSYSSYRYSDGEFAAVNVVDGNMVKFYQDNPAKVPGAIQQSLLTNRRSTIIASYDEPNDYYRMLAGIPPKNTTGGVIVTPYVEKALKVVPDNTIPAEGAACISITSARKLVRNTLIDIGGYVSIMEASIESTHSSVRRSFLVVSDEADIRTDSQAILEKDAIAICVMLGIPHETVYPGVYLYVNERAVVDSTLLVTESYLVIDSIDENYDPESMVPLVEARMNIPDVKPGEYVRLNGFLYPTYEYERTYGISRKVPIHKISEYYGDRYTLILDSLGYIKSLRESHQGEQYRYLEFLGGKRIPILRARAAKAFEILYLPDIKNDIVRKQFSVMYQGSRDYFMSTVFNYEYNSIYEYYENFIGLAICQMAIQQTIAAAQSTAISRDFYDSSMIKMLYDAYGIPFSSRLSQSTQNRVLKNINLLIQNKATNKVVYDIASLLGYHDIEVYKYYLVKERKCGVDGNPVFYDKTEMGFVEDADGNPIPGEVIINDLERMYEVYFQKVELKETDYQKAFRNTANRVDYDSITMPDPLWWDDQQTFDAVYGDPTRFTAETEPEIYHKHYNYTETKYLGITIAYRLSEVIYENIILLRMILDKKTELGDVVLTFPNITGSMEVGLFDTIVFLSAMICKQFHLTGEILTKASLLLHVIGYFNADADGYVPCDTLAFNFDLAKNAETFAEISGSAVSYLTDAELVEFNTYLSVLTVPETSQKEKVTAFNKMYQNVKGLGYFISDKIAAANTIDEYRAWRDLYNALYIGKELSEVFELGKTGRVASTYLEYLQMMNPRLYSVVEDCEDYLLYSYVDHVVYRMEQIIPDLKTLQSMNDSNSSAHEYLIKLIKFFKSYTTDMVNIDTQYIFDLKPDTLMKLVEGYNLVQVDQYSDVFHIIYSDAATIYLKSIETDEFKCKEAFQTTHVMRATDNLPINRIYRRSCVHPTCKYRCTENPGDCKVGRSCKFYGYDTSEFRSSCSRYIAIISSLERRVDVKITDALSKSVRDHLVRVGNLFSVVDRFRFTSTEDFDSLVAEQSGHLYRTLDLLNFQLKLSGSGVAINTDGVDALLEMALHFTSKTAADISSTCRNGDHPCMYDGECVSERKEQFLFDERIYPADNIFAAEYQRFAVSYGITDSLKLTEHSGYDEKIDFDESPMINYDDIISRLSQDARDLLRFMDGMLSEQAQVETDSIGLREEIYFFS